MKYYTITSFTHADGAVTPLNRSNVPEWSINQLERFHASYGDTLQYTYSHTLSDLPAFRQPTEEELADGETGYVLNP